MNWIPLALAVATAVLGVLSTILIKGFAAGKYLQRVEDHRNEMQDWREEIAKTLSDLHQEQHELARALRDEDHARRLMVDKVNTDMGRIDLRVAVLERQSIMTSDFDHRERESRDRRLEQLEEVVREILRTNNSHQRRS